MTMKISIYIHKYLHTLSEICVEIDINELHTFLTLFTHNCLTNAAVDYYIINNGT